MNSNQGWICPRCDAVYSPFMMGCNLCNLNKAPEPLKICDHVWDYSQIVLSDPPKIKCKKCYKTKVHDFIGVTLNV